MQFAIMLLDYTHFIEFEDCVAGFSVTVAAGLNQSHRVPVGAGARADVSL